MEQGTVFFTAYTPGDGSGASFNQGKYASGFPVGFGQMPRANVSIDAESNIVTRAVSISGAVAHNIVTQTGNYTLSAVTDYTVVANNSGSVLITLPASASISNIFNIKCITANQVTITNANGTDTIDGAKAITNSTQYSVFHLQADGNGHYYKL